MDIVFNRVFISTIVMLSMAISISAFNIYKSFFLLLGYFFIAYIFVDFFN